ncbi:unnamed protein product, partial [Didymodactylos carnosus]
DKWFVVCFDDDLGIADIISQAVLDNIMHPPIQTTATLGDGRTNIMLNGTVELSVTINDITTVITALIVASLGAKLVLGTDWCNSNNVTYECATNIPTGDE